MLENGVTEAARYAVTNQVLTDPNTGQPLSRSDSIKTVMRQSSPGIMIADGEFAYWDYTMSTADTGGPNDIIQIAVVHPWRFLFPFLSSTVGTFIIRVASTMRNEPPP